jgi:hypothetical protein
LIREIVGFSAGPFRGKSSLLLVTGLMCGTGLAQASDWTIDNVQIAGSTTVSGSQTRLEYGYGEGWKQLSGITTNSLTRGVYLWIEREPDSEEEGQPGAQSTSDAVALNISS